MMEHVCKMCNRKYEGHTNSKYCGSREDKDSCSYLVWRKQANASSQKWKKSCESNFLRDKYITYRCSAKQRNISFNLSFDEFVLLAYQDCKYCGSQIEGIGVDRVNNDIGYEVSNVVACCGTCNYMKRALPESDFKLHIKRLYEHLDLKDYL